MGNVITNISNVGTQKIITPSTYNASKTDQVINVKDIISTNEITINESNELFPNNIRKGTTIWDVTGSLDTPNNDNDYGSLYFNYNNKNITKLDYYSESSKLSSVGSSSYYRPTYCGVVQHYGFDTREWTIGVYDNYIYVGQQVNKNKYVKKINLKTNDEIWVCDLTNALEGNLGRPVMFFTDGVIWLATDNNGNTSGRLLTINNTNGSIITNRLIGEDAAAYQYINIDAYVSGTTCYVYTCAVAGLGVYFEKATYTSSGSFVTRKTSGLQTTDTPMYGPALFDSKHNCIVSSWLTQKSRNIQIFIFQESGDVYLHNIGGISWNELSYADDSSYARFAMMNFEMKYMIFAYSYNNDNGFAYASINFNNNDSSIYSTSNVSITSQTNMSGLTSISPFYLTRVKNKEVSNVNSCHYYACSEKFFVSFSTFGSNINIRWTERLNSTNFRIGKSELYVDAMNNIVYTGMNNDTKAFRDNSYYNITGYMGWY